MASILGIDVAKDGLAVHLVQEESARSASLGNRPQDHEKLCQWLKDQSVTELRGCLEATSVYHLGIATALYRAGYTVHVANSWSVKQYGKAVMKRSKTDPVDAKLLARYCRARDDLPAWSPLPPERAELRRLTRHRQSLLAQQSRLKCQLETQASPAVQASLMRQIAFLDGEVKHAEEAIEAHLKAHPELGEKAEHLRSIPGIGEVTSAVILAELGNYERFDDPGQVAAYAGLTPEAHQSGTSIHGQEAICKLGNERLRNALY